jgi:tRNA-Thr(GGU) m(6)t(6)A37 methyltransferase TsaA
VQLEPIGIVHSRFSSQSGTPVQPACAGREAVGTVEVYERFTEGLDDLEGFERIWLIVWFDRVGPVQMKVVPYLDTRRRGLFATRAPSRPNPIGISPVRLLRREGRILHVDGLDIFDGTPLLDIKPYSKRFDVFAVTRNGWMDDPETQSLREADDRFAPDS